MLDCQKPRKRKADPIRYPNGKGGPEICVMLTASGRREYKRRTEEMWMRQGGLCSICKRPIRLEEAQFEHQDGRGFNGGHRDDRTEINGQPYNSAACGWCNVEKASVRLKNYLIQPRVVTGMAIEEMLGEE